MSLSWKDTTATIGLVIVVGFAATLMLGAFENTDGRWGWATFAVLLFTGLIGAITGTSRVMKSRWSSVALYVLTAGALGITLVNIFLNSEGWFVAMLITLALMWLEFVGIDLFTSDNTTSAGRAGSRGAV